MKIRSSFVTFLGSIGTLFAAELRASCPPRPNLEAAAPPPLHLDFDKTSPSLPFVPFTLEDAEGRALPKDRSALLKLEPEEQERRLRAMQERLQTLRAEGFEMSDSLCLDAFAERSMSVAAYESEINAAERELNKVGQTLRHGQDILGQEQQAFDHQSLEHHVKEGIEVYTGRAKELYDESVARIDSRMQELAQKYEDYKTKAQNLTVEDLYREGEKHKCEPNAQGTYTSEQATCFLKGVADPTLPPNDPLIDPRRNDCAADTPLGRAYLLREHWVDGGGDTNFGWTGTAAFSLETDATGLRMRGDADLEALVFDHNAKIVAGKASFLSPRTGKTAGSLHMNVAGQKLLNEELEWDLSLIDSKDKDGAERYLMHKEQHLLTTTIPVGFVPVVLMVDMKLSAGPTYGLNLAPIKVWGRAEWTQSADIIASAGLGADLNVFVILAGVKGSLELAKLTLGAYPEAGLYLDDTHRPVINARLWAGSKMRTLAGSLNLGVWAKTTFAVPQPKGDFPFLEMKPLTYEWSRNLGNFPGYDFPQAVLFDKKIGYDICSGRKTVETLVEAQPRSHDQRESLEVKELTRVSKLEQDLITLLDQKLYSAEATALIPESSKALDDLAALRKTRELIQQELLEEALSSSPH